MDPLSDSLKQLPAFDPPAGGWPRLMRARAARSRRTRAAYGGLALAACLLITLSVSLSRPQPATAVAASGEITVLMERSRRLEGQLAQVRPQVALWNAPLARRALNLQNDLTVVDLQLNYAQDDGARRLWQDRVALMSQLVATHQQAAALPAANNPQTEISL